MIKSVFKLAEAIAKTAKEIKAEEKKQDATRNNSEYEAREKRIYLLAYKMEKMSKELQANMATYREVIDEVDTSLVITPEELMNVNDEVINVIS